MRTPVYASDIEKDLLNDAFFGEGFEELLKEAERKGVDVIVGYWKKKPELD